MAYGNVLGYTPAAQPGAYLFQQKNGPPQMLYGAPAEDLKAKLDASAGLAGQQVAGPGGGASGSEAQDADRAAMAHTLGGAASAIGNFFTTPRGKFIGAGAPPAAAPPAPAAPPAAPPTPAAAAPAPIAPPGPPVGATAEGVPPALARPEEQAAPQAHPLEAGDLNTGIIIGPDGRAYAPNPGVAAVTQDQLAAKYGQANRLPGEGVAAPHSVSTTIAGGFAPDTDYLERRADLAIDKRLNIDKIADVEAENAVRDKQVADQQAAMAAQQLKDQQDAQAKAQAMVDKDVATRDRLQAELGNAKVMPNRIFSGKSGAWTTIGAALASALGTAGQGMQAMGGHAGMPNIGAQMVQSAIDKDIAAQENEIKVKGDLANNALSQWMHSGQSLEQAKLGLKGAQLQWTAAQLAQTAAQNKGAMVDPQRDMLHNQVLSALNDANEQYRQQSIGNRTQQVASQVVYAHGASGGGLRPLSPDQTLELAKKKGEIASGGIKNAQELYNLQHPKNPAAAKAQGQLANIAAAKQALLEAAAKGGQSYDEKTGELKGSARAVLPVGSELLRKDATSDYINALHAAAPLVQSASGVKRLGDEESSKWAAHGTTSAGQMNGSFLQAELRKLDTLEREVRAGGGTPAAPETAAEAEPEK